ncbi:MAG TPA: 30S ribosomal protein S11 [Patescibacteria group bacterium]|nr:30S ribosomal protein S11 [Patescibacteria group bacterium]
MTEQLSNTPPKQRVAEEATTTADLASKVKATTKKKKGKSKVSKGRITVNSTFNNTLISISDQNGNVIVWGTAGRTGFKGSKKSTPYAGQKTMEDALARAKDRGLSEVDILIKGVGAGRESALRAIQSSGLNVLTIKDRTPTPHGGVRPKKPRRV